MVSFQTPQNQISGCPHCAPHCQTSDSFKCENASRLSMVSTLQAFLSAKSALFSFPFWKARINIKDYSYTLHFHPLDARYRPPRVPSQETAPSTPPCVSSGSFTMLLFTHSFQNTSVSCSQNLHPSPLSPPLKLASFSHRRSDCELSDICLLTCFYLLSFPQGFQAASSKVHTENGS